eukprot:3808549-Rhodomonas_salina.1
MRVSARALGGKRVSAVILRGMRVSAAILGMIRVSAAVLCVTGLLIVNASRPVCHPYRAAFMLKGLRDRLLAASRTFIAKVSTPPPPEFNSTLPKFNTRPPKELGRVPTVSSTSDNQMHLPYRVYWYRGVTGLIWRCQIKGKCVVLRY